MSVLRLMKINEATAAKRRVWFDLRDEGDGITPATSMGGQQPQIRRSASGWSNVGISGLSHTGFGRYYAEITQATLNLIGDRIETRFGYSGVAAETPGDSVAVVAYDPDTDIKTILDQAMLIDSTGVVVLPENAGAAEALNMETALFYTRAFSRTPLDVTGWAKFTLTIKANPFTEEDEDSLLLVRLTSPAAGTDGILIKQGRIIPTADAMRTQANIQIISASPNASVRISLEAGALTLPPSPESQPYTYEINYWDAAGSKRLYARGSLILTRSVRRAIVAP